jgi:uncharacterized protein YndB with AHSA1/START domain
MKVNRGEELRLDRVILAPVSSVWSAWTTSAGLRRWWWNHWPDVEIDVDPVVGGRYRFSAPHADIVVSGAYLEVIEEQRLSFSWRWEDADGVQDGDVVDVVFSSVPEGTRVTVTHRGSWHDASASENYRQGWTFVLDALNAALDAAAGSPAAG